MRKLYKITMLVFLRSKSLIIPYLAVLAMFSAYTAFRFIQYMEYQNIFMTLRWFVIPCVFLIASFIYFSYELTIKLHENNMAEYFRAYRQGLWQAYGAIILCLLTLVAIPSTMFLLFMLFFYNYINVEYYPFMVHLLKVSLLYFGMSFIAGILLGTVMAAKLKSNRLAVYSLTVLFMLLNTTVTSNLFFHISYMLLNSYPLEKVLFGIKDFFTLVPHQLGSNFAIDPIYGLPTEPIRWILAGFWIIFPLTLIMSECFNHKVKKTLTAMACLVLVLSVGLFVFRGSTLVMDLRNDSYPYSDMLYYDDRPEADYRRYQTEFTISNYNMDLTVSNELHAIVKITVDNPALHRYEFTLYRGYILDEVRTEKEAIPFKREGDYISIGSLNGSDHLIFEYHGKSPKYYANRQAITLPGYFAYYPKAGRRNIFDVGQSAYVINLSPNESRYEVKVHSDLNVFCNLSGSNKTFHGKTDGVSLFAGMYDEIADNIYAEPMRRDLPQKQTIPEAEQILLDTFKRLERPQPEALKRLADKKLFQVPGNFTLNSGIEASVVMSDHITAVYCSNGSQVAENIMQSVIKPHSTDNRLEYDYLSYLFNQKDITDPFLKKPVDLQQLLQEIDEWRSLKTKLQKVNAEQYERMSKQEKAAYETDGRRMFDLDSSVNNKAALYLFYQSPHKAENFRVFYDYYTSEGKEDYMELVKRIIKGEIEHADRQ